MHKTLLNGGGEGKQTGKKRRNKVENRERSWKYRKFFFTQWNEGGVHKVTYHESSWKLDSFHQNPHNDYGGGASTPEERSSSLWEEELYYGLFSVPKLRGASKQHTCVPARVSQFPPYSLYWTVKALSPSFIWRAHLPYRWNKGKIKEQDPDFSSARITKHFWSLLLWIAAVMQTHCQVSHKKNTGFKLVCAPEARQKHLSSVLKHCGPLASGDALNIIHNAISPDISYGIPQTALSKVSPTITGNQSPRWTKSSAWEPSSLHCLSE